jgi:hypothetical protein
VLYLFDDTLVANAFQVRDGELTYDISAPSYAEMADIVLSKAHVQQEPKYARLAPDESIKRNLNWTPRNKVERNTVLQGVLIRATVSDQLPKATGVAFAQVFGAAPSGCTREVRAVLDEHR